MAHVVILGAGTGGTPAAYEMRQLLDKSHTVTLINASETFQFVPSNPWVAVNWRKQEDIEVDLAPIFAKKGIAFKAVAARKLDPEAPLCDVISPGSDHVEIGGTKKHVIGYLEDFLFAPERARSPVSSLSGGERNRLLLAKLFTKPANVLVLDEPTNDLDIDTLELLEELLQDFGGTVFLVSHDRRFIDNVVTSTIAWEGDEAHGGRPGPP